MGEVETTLKENVGLLRRQLTGESQDSAIPSKPPGSGDHGNTQRFRPLRRPPMILLGLLSDGREHIQWVHVRSSPFRIGRTEADVLIPHDNAISSTHVELQRVVEDGEYRWYLCDLESTNGTFANVASSRLKHEDEILIGDRRLKFLVPTPGSAASDGPQQPDAPVRQPTQKWQAQRPLSPESLLPALVEQTPDGEGKRHLLHHAEQWIGADPAQCSIVLEGDLFADPRHARIYRDAQQCWWIEDSHSLNDTWYRIRRVHVARGGEFQIGEQRFCVRVC